ncbi:MAG: hypothetical protein WC745_02045 [Patescibacteria group bacterium]|jgi:hypothetical protein
MINNKYSNQTDLIQYAGELGKKIGFLIAGLNIPERAKEALFLIIEDFSLDQLERLNKILETRLISEETGFIEDELKIELEKIKNDYFKGEEKLNLETLAKLNGV